MQTFDINVCHFRMSLFNLEVYKILRSLFLHISSQYTISIFSCACVRLESARVGRLSSEFFCRRRRVNYDEGSALWRDSARKQSASKENDMKETWRDPLISF
jgi:hypothetical protein